MSTSTDTIQLPTGTWAIDGSHTEVGFVARHLMVSKVRGTFRDVSGTVEVAEDITVCTLFSRNTARRSTFDLQLTQSITGLSHATAATPSQTPSQKCTPPCASPSTPSS